MDKSRRFCALREKDLTPDEAHEIIRLRRWYYKPFRTLMRDYAEWHPHCYRWGSVMGAAFAVSDYMAMTWSEYPLDYQPGVSGAGAIISEEENAELFAYLQQFSREELRVIAAKLGRYIEWLKQEGVDY